MDPVAALSSIAVLASILAVVMVAAFVHGLVGMGFPVITTPLIAMASDLKTAIIATVLPNIALNPVSIFKGGKWRHSLGQHGWTALYVAIGAVVGTHILLGVPQEPLKLVLAIALVVHLNASRLQRIDWGWLQRHPQLSRMGFGPASGLLSGTVNVSLPPLVIYFMALGLAPATMVQILNLCFIASKSTQFVTFGIAGAFDVGTLTAAVPLTVVAVVCLLAGIRIRERTQAAVYYRWLNIVLWLMVLVLLGQVAIAWLR